jgi:chromosome segregation protein
MPVGELSIQRRLDRNGEGEYRLNGARCRLIDVLEVLSDTGLGKEMHSVISQGRVEAIVTSKPRDRRLLIEEAAGLGKHRKRRRRAQLKLERTQDNLDRALDIEREARSRLRPLKRQAEAAELHARLERQSTEARWKLARDVLRARRGEVDAAVARRRRRASSRRDTGRAGRAARREAASRRWLAAASSTGDDLASIILGERCVTVRLERGRGVAGRARAAASRARAARAGSRPTPATGRRRAEALERS